MTDSQESHVQNDPNADLFLRVVAILPPWASHAMIREALEQYQADPHYVATATDAELIDFVMDLVLTERMKLGARPDEFVISALCVNCGQTRVPLEWPLIRGYVALTCPWCANDAGDHLH